MADPAYHGAGGHRGPRSASEWLAGIATLTVAPPLGWSGDEVTTATALASELAAAARALVAHGVVARAGCDAGCPLCDLGVGSCELVRDLGGVLPDAGTAPTPSIAGFRNALAHAGGAVFVCRRTLHPAGTCLFRAHSEDLCGRVLAATHNLG